MEIQQLKRNRSLVADMAWVLKVAEELQDGHVIIEPFTTRNRQHKTVKRVLATLMHTGEGVALSGIGKTATEAVGELRWALDLEVERAKARNAR